jgi:hypothetical protein
MPSSEEIISAKAEVVEIAIKKVMKQEGVSRQFAAKYVSKLSDDELAEVSGCPKGGAYAAW